MCDVRVRRHAIIEGLLYVLNNTATKKAVLYVKLWGRERAIEKNSMHGSRLTRE